MEAIPLAGKKIRKSVQLTPSLRTAFYARLLATGHSLHTITPYLLQHVALNCTKSQ
jgi:hypothetical protein